MKNIKYTKTLIVIVLLLFTLKGFSQLSKTHYIPPLTYGDWRAGFVENQYMYLSTPSTTNVTYKITAVGQPTVFAEGSDLNNATPLEFKLGDDGTTGNLFMHSTNTSQVTSDKGYIIEASVPIYVSIRVNAFNQAGALVSKGHSALGTTFRSGHFTSLNPLTTADGAAYKSFISVMATEDGTEVTFDDLPAGLVIESYTGPKPITTTLNRGESYIVTVDGPSSRDLIGCLITTKGKPIVVNSGSAVGSFGIGSGGGRDYGFDQIVDIENLGQDYIFIHGARPSGGGRDNSDDWETVLIVAHEDNTEIFVNNSATPIRTINAGEYFEIKGGNYDANDNMYVRTTKNVYAYQGVGGLNNSGNTNEANQGMFLVPALSCETRGNIDNIPNIDQIGGKTYKGGISIVAEAGALVTLNGRDINDPIFSAQGFIIEGPYSVTTDVISGNKPYEVYKLRDLRGDIAIATASGGELYCSYYNYNANATSGAFYSGFTTEPEIIFNLTSNPIGTCVPNVTLVVASPSATDIYEWLEDNDGDGTFIPALDASGLPATGTSYKPNIEGTYKVRVTTCSTKTFESEPVTVTDCNSDRDVDLDTVLNNIDIDNDNDGILDCTESYGDKVIDLLTPSDTSDNTKMAFYGFSNTENIVSSSGNSATDPKVVKDNTGVFTSATSARPDTFTESSIEYTITFNKALNVLLEEAPGGALLTTDQILSIKVPSNRALTLLNPADQLLIDTDLDGIFESGITEFTASEIIFKLNGTSATNNFQFKAWNVSELIFKHLNESTSASNKVSLKISAYCLPRDSDGDGIYNSLDLDSDNDGIPDFIESLAPNNLTLSGTVNSDGLDTIFTGTEVQVDTDTDGVFDYLDLDSDNDGIYDVQELEFNLPDINFDGIIDDITLTMGQNGWDDNAESLPDSGIIKAPVDDADNDGVFNYIDLDSDDDGCNDVAEAPFIDDNADGILGNVPITVDLTNGKVTSGGNGYTGANTDYITAGGTTIIINTQPIDFPICASSDIGFTVDSNASIFQWEISEDNGTTWSDVVDGTVSGTAYTGAQTESLNITNVPDTFNNYQYRAFLNNTSNPCNGLYTDIVTLAVNPSATLTAPNDIDGCASVLGGTTADFNLRNQTDIILGIPNPTGYVVNYYADAARTILIPDADLDVYNSTDVTIYARVERPSGCLPQDYDFDLIVNPLPVIASPVSYELCDDDDDINDGFQTFNLTTLSPTILGPQTTPPYSVKYFLASDDSEITNPSSYENKTPYRESLIARVFGAGGCVSTDLNFDLIVNPRPDFTISAESPICSTIPGSSVELTPIESDPTIAYDYEWIKVDDPAFIPVNTRIYEAFEAGVYQITLTNTDGSGCSRSKEVVVLSSEPANITLNDVKIVDISTYNSVTIINTDLGLGDYEYALEDIDLTIDDESKFRYQDGTAFNNVRAGFYNLWVRDKKGCGTAHLEITILGYDKFFTPNNDGSFDSWQIRGVDAMIKPFSAILIYNRYGKLIKQLDPLGAGWDGTFNGQRLPSDDYWFTVALANGTNFVGHFALKR